MDGNVASCPYDRYRQMRRTGVTEVQPGVYAITRYEDVKRMLMDWRDCSAVLGDNNSFATYGQSPVQDQIDQVMRDYPERPALMRTDPPAHTRVRDLVNRALTPAEVEKIEPDIAAIVADLAAPWIGRGEVEFTGAFATRLPGAVITRFLGAPPEMEARFKFWAGETMSRFDGPQSPDRQLEVARNLADMGRYFLGQIAERRRRPAGDLVSLLAHAEIGGDRLEDVAIVNVIQTFLIGGHETTAFLLGNAFWRFANDPALAEALRANPGRTANFVEEMLRIDAPAQSVMRRATRDLEVDGVQVPAGSTLLLMLGSANRDEAVFEAPDDLRLDRPTPPPGSRHMAFGYGVHACIGLNLARAEARIALEYLLPRMKDIVPASDDPICLMDNFMLRGPTRLNLHFAPT